MAVTLEQVFSEAERLTLAAKEEVQFRNAASRYYYAFFHRALRLANSEALRSGDAPPHATAESTHKALRDFFEYFKAADVDSRRNGRFLKAKLSVSHAARCLADYRLDHAFSIEDLNVHIRNCDGGIKLIMEMEGQPDSGREESAEDKSVR